MKYNRGALVWAIALASCLSACNTKSEKQKTMEKTTTSKTAEARDSHSYANPEEIAVKHLDLNIEVSFEQKTIKGTATYKLERKADSDKIILDSRELKI